jgi:hypothetical protein
VALVHELALAETHTPQNIIPLPPGGVTRSLHPETEHMTYCMGWVRQDYRGKLLLSHGGTIDGFRAYITLAPKENRGIVLLNNRHGTDMNIALGYALWDYLLQLPPREWNAQLGKVARERDAADKKSYTDRPKKRHQDTKPSLKLEEYAGTYIEPAFGVSHVSVENGKLMWEWSTFKCPLEHFHYDTFIAQSELLHDPFVNFSLGLDGKPATMNAVERYFVRVGGP